MWGRAREWREMRPCRMVLYMTGQGARKEASRTCTSHSASHLCLTHASHIYHATPPVPRPPPAPHSTSSELSLEEQAAAGIPPAYVRMSVGITGALTGLQSCDCPMD